jgi:hypothetical protein
MTLPRMGTTMAMRRGLLLGALCVIGCGTSGGSKAPDASGADADGAGVPTDCTAVCGRVQELCSGRPEIDDLWLDACRSQCQARVQLEPDVAALESSCVIAASVCDTAVTCAATPTAPPSNDAGADLADARPSDSGSDARDAAADTGDAPTSTDVGFGPSMVRASVDGTPVVFDRVTNVQLVADVIIVEAWTSDQTRSITTYTAGGTGVLGRLPATYGCTTSDIGYLHYTAYGAGGPDAGAGQTYGDTPYGSSPCSVTYTRVDFTRIQGTFSATARGPSGSVMIASGVIDVAVP